MKGKESFNDWQKDLDEDLYPLKIPICPICKLPMVHYRLFGYKCHNQEHNEQVAVEQAIMLQRILGKQK